MIHDQIPLLQPIEHVTADGQRLLVSVDFSDRDDMRIVTVTGMPLGEPHLSDEMVTLLRLTTTRVGMLLGRQHQATVQVSGRLTLTYEAEFLRVRTRQEEEW